MGEITAQAVKAFREKTGLPLMDCKRALAEAGGDEEKAIEMLRKSRREAGTEAIGSRHRFWPFRHLLRTRQERRRDGGTEVRKRSGHAERRVHSAGQRPGRATGHGPRSRDGRRAAGSAVAQQARA